MKKNAITMSGFLCLVATGARAQSFEQQVLNVRQEVSDAIPHTRRAAAFIDSIRRRGGDLESERRAALATASGIVKNPDSFSIRQIGDVLELLDILREIFRLEDPARPALDKARDQLNEIQRTLVARHFNPRPQGETERRVVLAAAAEIVKNPSAFTLHQIVDVAMQLDILRGSCAPGDPARSALDEARNQLTVLILSDSRP